MRTTIATLAAAALLLTGCGSGSDAPEPADETTTAAPVVYTPEQLLAAMPELADVPGGAEDQGRCPEDGEELCGPGGDDDTVRALYTVEPTSPVARSRAEAVGTATPMDFIGLAGTTYPDQATATQERTTRQADLEQFDGDFDVPDQEVEGGTVPGERGIGTMRELTIGPWEGYVSDRAVVDPDDPSGEPVMLVAQISLTSGSTLINAFVSLTAGGRETDAAGQLGENLLRDYVERLGR